MTETLNAKLEAQRRLIDNIEKVKELYPDLKESKDRWGTVYHSTPSINSKVNEVEFRHSCGCCADASLLAYFYEVIHGIKVFADPFSIYIGNQNEWGWGDIANADWRENLRKHRIPEHLYDRVEKYFAEHPPESYDDSEKLSE